MPEITVKTTKAFNTDGLGSAGKYVKRGAEITVDEFLARDLHRNGLIEDYDVKNASTPQNKQAAKPENKAAGKPKPETDKKGG
jgi:hypothetical protein